MSTYAPIARQTIGSAASSVTFSSIPQNYTDLVIVACFKAASTTIVTPSIRFNGDTGSNYSNTTMYGTGSSATSVRYTNKDKSYLGDFAAGVTTNAFVPYIISVSNYSNNTTYKTFLCRYTQMNSSSGEVGATAGLWRNTNAITSLTITSDGGQNFAADSTFTVYGIAVGNSSAKATGGNIVVTDGSYWYHAFTSSGTFIPEEALTADVLVVAGGGAGGWDLGGGGGAGGCRQLTSQSLLSQAYPVVVGAGGSITNTTPSGSGTNSIFGTISATGGGGGDRVSLPNSTGANGGSGGGGAGDGNAIAPTAGGSGNAGGYTPVEGYAGQAGAPYSSGQWTSGGGGGAGAAANSKNGANGATSSLINAIASAIKIGQLSSGNYYFAGGGGGATLGNPAGTGGSGGLGGGQEGNSGSYVMTGTKALINTGSGGGGGWTSDNKGAGASGIVVVRYAV